MVVGVTLEWKVVELCSGGSGDVLESGGTA